MDPVIKEEVKNLCETVLFEEPLSKHTSMRVGGLADAFLYPKTIDELAKTVQYARKRNLPLFVLGAGSNLLVRDKGIRGLVVHLAQGFGQMRIEEESQGEVVIYVEAGVGLPRLVDFTAEEGLTGLEALCGIPANIGGALWMNAGTREGEIADHLLSVTFVDKEGRLQTKSRESLKFDYRESHFPKGAIVVSAKFRLKRHSSELVKGLIQKTRNHRIETQPLNVPNLGSVFKNPDKKKVFAGKLIEETGLKNVRVGGARVSPKHGNFIVNEGGATAKDVMVLIRLVREKVKERFGILLEPEVKVVGEE